jgi:hypothetical protein
MSIVDARPEARKTHPARHAVECKLSCTNILTLESARSISESSAQRSGGDEAANTSPRSAAQRQQNLRTRPQSLPKHNAHACSATFSKLAPTGSTGKALQNTCNLPAIAPLSSIYRPSRTMNRQKKIKQILKANAKKASAKLAPKSKPKYICKADRLKLAAEAAETPTPAAES